jgi:hypothetical protein
MESVGMVGRSQEGLFTTPGKGKERKGKEDNEKNGRM